MYSIIISDTSCLILLDKIGRLELLKVSLNTPDPVIYPTLFYGEPLLTLPVFDAVFYPVSR